MYIHTHIHIRIWWPPRRGPRRLDFKPPPITINIIIIIISIIVIMIIIIITNNVSHYV